MRLDLYVEPSQDDILKSLGMDKTKIPRYRGCGIQDGKIIIHTRTGGGNREHYDSVENIIDSAIGELLDFLKAPVVDITYRRIFDYISNNTDNPITILKNDCDKAAKKAIKEVIEAYCTLEINIITIRHQNNQNTNDYLRQNPYYIEDEDDDYDNTYANWYFRIPDDCKATENKLTQAIYKNTDDYVQAKFANNQEAKQRIIERIENITDN